MADSRGHDEATFNRAYLTAVQHNGANGTATFGFRLMWENLNDLGTMIGSVHPNLSNHAERLEAAFGLIAYVHLSRRNKVAQAVSLLKALQTGLWHIAGDGTERQRSGPPQAPVYDAVAIGETVAELDRHDAAWTHWFTAHNIHPVHVTYESLSVESEVHLGACVVVFGFGSNPCRQR